LFAFVLVARFGWFVAKKLHNIVHSTGDKPGSCIKQAHFYTAVRLRFGGRGWLIRNQKDAETHCSFMRLPLLGRES
jgi:hypothetical protein